MGTGKRGGAEEAADKALGWIGETAGRMQGEETLEAERRAARRMGGRTTYYVRAPTQTVVGRFRPRGRAEPPACTRPRARP